MIMHSVRSIIYILILLGSLIIQSSSQSVGTVSSDYGRISNLPNDRIHVSAALTQAECIRQCLDFQKNHNEYPYDDCLAYNYNIDQQTCELIHSSEPIDYITSTASRWKTGLKF